MTKHYKDSSGKIYGFKPDSVEVEEITIEEARKLIESKKTSPTNEEIELLLAQAYADTANGSDRLFIKYQAALAQGSDTAEAKKEAWLARREEIKAEYPFND